MNARMLGVRRATGPDVIAITSIPKLCRGAEMNRADGQHAVQTFRCGEARPGPAQNDGGEAEAGGDKANRGRQGSTIAPQERRTVLITSCKPQGIGHELQRRAASCRCQQLDIRGILPTKMVGSFDQPESVVSGRRQ